MMLSDSYYLDEILMMMETEPLLDDGAPSLDDGFGAMMFVELMFYVRDGCYLDGKSLVMPMMISVTFSTADALDIYELLE